MEYTGCFNRGCTTLPLFVLLILLAGALTFSGCGGQSSRDYLDVAIFQGGYGKDFFEEKAKEFEEKHPELLTPEGSDKPLSIRITGHPRIWEQLRSRFVSGDVPDLAWPGWGMDYWMLVAEGQVLAANPFLEQPAFDQDVPWKDTFVEPLLTKGSQDGKYYLLPFNNNLFAWWYNKAMFEENGWTPPKTYPELLALAEKIKAKGIDPITYQGKYPDYALRGFFFPWAISIGGIEAFNDAQDLKPGAWKSPAFLQAARMIAELRDKGFFAAGALGKTHTQAQSDFVAGKAAFIPCGTWLATEQADDIKAHPEFDMEFMLTPIVPGGKGDPTAICTGTEDFIIPSKAQHPEIAAEFFRYLTSQENTREWVKRKQTFTCIKGSEEVELPKYLVKPAELYTGSRQVWTAQFAQWYPSLKREAEDALRQLLAGSITPEQCVELIEQAATKVRNDPKIIKHKVARAK